MDLEDGNGQQRAELAGATTGSPPGQVPGRRWWTLAVVSVAQLLVVLDGTIVNIALPSAQQALHMSDGNRHWAITAYALTFGGLLLIGGRVSGALGHRRAFLIGLLGFGVSSALGGAAVNPVMLFGARALQGAFAAVLAPAGLSLLAGTFTRARERGRAFGVFAAVGAAGSAVGLIAGGLLTEYADWRWCLYINVPIALVAALGLALMPPTARSPGQEEGWTSPVRCSASPASLRWCTGSPEPSPSDGAPAG
ncbi:MFS transporter [Actinomadura madurae]|uniref:MFS transporter n=1 Tax=Actinomadura madurae TaxID=1993 RepID=UPI0020D21458|nr:MFS transporter [Actinomadura madurae]MCQ0018747.1 MFS transporter [Actinomadura madurae]